MDAGQPREAVVACQMNGRVLDANDDDRNDAQQPGEHIALPKKSRNCQRHTQPLKNRAPGFVQRPEIGVVAIRATRISSCCIPTADKTLDWLLEQ